MNKVPQLRVILLGLVAGLRAVGSVMMLMGLVMFLYAIIGFVFFGTNDPAHFGGVAIGMLTLFRTATLASWGGFGSRPRARVRSRPRRAK
jgi:voltage-gated sodium channel